MSSPADFAWRMPAPDDWLERCQAVDTVLRGAPTATALDEAAAQARQLARCRLGPRAQMKLEGLARRLAAANGAPANFRRFRLGVLSARTLTYLKGPLLAAGLARGLLMEVLEAPYDQLAEFAYSPVNPFAGETLDAVLVFADSQSFPGGGGPLDTAAEEERLANAGRFLSALTGAVREKARCPAIVATLPDTAGRMSSTDRLLAGAETRFTLALNTLIAGTAADGQCLLWDAAALAGGVGLHRWFDPVRYHQAKAPFAIELCPLAADSLCALIAAITGKAGRVAVLDLDNTLWGGVIGDDGLAGLRLGQNSPEGEAYAAFQRFLLSLRARGVVLAVCSKNTDAIAREPFRNHPEMVLREEHIAVFQANWLDKATNIKNVAEALNLGLESLVFIDDNPAERERVRQELPLVNVPEIGDEPALFERHICASGAFEHLLLNADDVRRADAYGAEAKRAEIRSSVGNYDEYLASLKMRMVISPFDEVGRARITQLINKSNQFNLTTRRYNEEEVRQLAADPRFLCWQVRLDDAFGAHGMIAVVIVEKADQTWRIDSWLQSCRVLGRGVEETIMNRLMAEAAHAGAAGITWTYIPTPRNEMVADFYDRLGFEVVGEGAEGKRYACRPTGFAPLKSFMDVQFDDVRP